jgi:hypothetical protein
MKFDASKFVPIARDVAGCSGIMLVVAGVHDIYAPAGVIVAGLCLVGGAFQTARRA